MTAGSGRLTGAPFSTLEQAWRLLQREVLAHVGRQPPGVEVVDSLDALGRVLAQDVISGCDVPPWDNSAMDGYALRSADGGQAAQSLRCTQRIAAGDTGRPVEPGECARIFTGAPVPPQADAVIMQEHTRERAGQVELLKAVVAGQNVRLAGEDIARGQCVLSAGRPLGPAALGVAASVGLAQLQVHVPPRVSVLTTGNELTLPGQPLAAGRIYNSNRHALHALVQASGGRCRDGGIVPDDLGATRQALQRLAQDSDLIISSGGVSVGDADHVGDAVASVGGLELWSLAIKPGKPFAFGWIGRPDGSRALFVGLPGNPAASAVTFLLLVRPLLACLAGQAWVLPQARTAVSGFSWVRPDAQRREFLRARQREDGSIELHPHQGSGVLSSLAWGDGLVDLPAQSTLHPGDAVLWLPWSELLQPAAASRQP